LQSPDGGTRLQHIETSRCVAVGMVTINRRHWYWRWHEKTARSSYMF